MRAPNADGAAVPTRTRGPPDRTFRIGRATAPGQDGQTDHRAPCQQRLPRNLGPARSRSGCSAGWRTPPIRSLEQVCRPIVASQRLDIRNFQHHPAAIGRNRQCEQPLRPGSGPVARRRVVLCSLTDPAICLEFHARMLLKKNRPSEEGRLVRRASRAIVKIALE